MQVLESRYEKIAMYVGQAAIQRFGVPGWDQRARDSSSNE